MQQQQRFGMKSRGQGYRRKSILSACQAHNYTFKLDKDPFPLATRGEKKRRTQSVLCLPQTREQRAHNKIISIITHLDSTRYVYFCIRCYYSWRQIEQRD
jgi:hypothetical protein